MYLLGKLEQKQLCCCFQEHLHVQNPKHYDKAQESDFSIWVNSKRESTLSPSEFRHHSTTPPLFVIQWFYLLNSFALCFLSCTTEPFSWTRSCLWAHPRRRKTPHCPSISPHHVQNIVFNFPGLLLLWARSAHPSPALRTPEQSKRNDLCSTYHPFLEAAPTTQANSTDFKQ